MIKIDRERLWPVIGTHSAIVAAGPLTHQPSTIPYRYVVRQEAAGQFVVCCEYFKMSGACLSHDCWGNGDYFAGPEALMDAVGRFAYVVKRDVPHYYSLKRKEQAVGTKA
jgi:hypothetical protein